MKMKVYVAVAAWFLLALGMSLGNQFVTEPGKPPLLFGLTLVVPMALFLAAYARRGAFWSFCQTLDLRVLTGLHVWRVVGISFLLLYAQGRLPGGFALPAGIGDMVAGVAAIPLILGLSSKGFPVRGWFVGWNLFGLADLAVALGSGILHSPGLLGLLAGAGPTTLMMTQFPRSLIPTFLVPVFILLHLLMLARSHEVPGHSPALRLGTAES